MLEKRLRKSLSIVLTLCLLAGMIPDAAFAEDETNAVVAEAETEASVGESETTVEEAGTAKIAETETETEIETETAAEAQPATEAATETVVTEAESGTESAQTEVASSETYEPSVETESGTEQETETETETESETNVGLLGSTAATICDHGNDAGTCVICEVEALIDELPTIDEISGMDTDGQNEIYTQASDICDIYYDELTEDEQDQVTNIDDLWEVLDYFSGAISLTAASSITYLDITGEEQSCSDYTSVTAQTTWGTSGEEIWYVVDNDTTISDRITVNGTVNLILVNGYTLTASSGIAVNDGNTLNIYGQTGGTGKIEATGGDLQAGIGGDSNKSCGTITIIGGTVTAIGGSGGAGIGGGSNGGDGSNITISGGTVKATGGTGSTYASGAGIGGGSYGSGSNITIKGSSNVTATGGAASNSSGGGAGIGGGGSGSNSGSNITIIGGTVKATGGTGGSGGAGIGGGGAGYGSYITITGGMVEAIGGDGQKSGGGAGIGGGHNKSGTYITITSGTVVATGGSGSNNGNGAGIGGGNKGAGSDISISGGYIIATSGGNSASIIGAGSSGSTGTITITGGYFGSGIAGASGTGEVYDCAVASGYEVYENTDETTKSTYPVYVAKTVTVTIDGTATYGQTLTATVDGTDNVTGYQWLRGDSEISDATASTYTLTADDVGKAISVKITCSSDKTVTSDTVTVEKATLTASISGSTSKTYNGSTTVSGNGLSIALSGTVNSENPAVTASFAYSDANAGTGKTINATNIILSELTDRYTLSNTEAAADVGIITQATPTVSLETKTATYTGSAISIDAAAVTLVNSEVYSGDITYTQTSHIKNGSVP